MRLLVLAILVAVGLGGARRLCSRSAPAPARRCSRSFPFLFFLLFISSMNMPRNLIEVDWFRIAATLNPVSYMIEGLRALIIDGWDVAGARARLRLRFRDWSRSR